MYFIPLSLLRLAAAGFTVALECTMVRSRIY